MSKAVLIADRFLAQGRIEDAVATIERASASEDSDASFLLALWKLAGEPLARDLTGARGLLRKATTAGNVDAALVEVALVANGTGAAPDWAKARNLLEQMANRNDIAAAQLALIERMAIDVDGMPTQLPNKKKIAEKPDVWHIEGLFTPEECLHVAQSAADLLQPAVVVDPQTGRNIANPVRTSDGAVIGPTRATMVVQALTRRIARITNTEWRQSEAISILRYRRGQQFRPHLDALPSTHNQRIRTVLVYLNDGFKGGATYFVGHKLRISPKAGDAIIFNNVTMDGDIDHAAQHAGEPVLEGVKWLATSWIRERPFDVWTGPEFT
ncbi:2OG-Fe(II) oxygenase [Sphingomonas sp. Leaf357]|uniref:2OG-Fe(II) oxygenase n=1 Tax=Sphingomonas sp. Leaf357 TaxID=1736350 RepID=UPI0009E99388|nr:2OG-Fe(II) oxygenase [Sphingomonas sp. Leaf357]